MVLANSRRRWADAQYEAMLSSHLLYLHGFRSSPRSTKAQLTLEAVRARAADMEIYCPALSASPHQAITDIEVHTAKWPKARTAIVGSSLGGFYATYLAERWGCKAVLLNPAVYPARDLAAHLGEQTLWQDPQTPFIFERRYLDELRSLEVSSITHPDRYFAVIAKGDEVLDWREMTGHYSGARIRLLEGSDHALSDYPEHLGAVLDFLLC